MKKDRFEGYDLSEYPEVEDIEFPEALGIAYAVCGRSCGNAEFIVDGQTQVCEHCGKKMFRTIVKRFVRAADRPDDPG